MEDSALNIPGYRFILGIMSRVTSVKSARGVSFAVASLSLASKPFGYARTFLIAWAFGTTPGMDAFHLAFGIASLFAVSIGSALENAVLPELVRIKGKNGGVSSVCSSTAAFVSCFIITLAVAFAVALAAVPERLVRFFASGFDAERTLDSVIMLRWLIPFALVAMYKPMLDIWANVLERYTLSPMIGTLFNIAAIPALLASIPLIGVYSVAFSISAGHAVVFILFLAAMRGAPARWRASAVDWGCVKRICWSTAYLTAVMAAGTLYTVVDRYFASRLPVGSVASISYAASLIGIAATLASAPMTYFLSIITKSAATDRLSSLDTMRNAARVALAYLAPLSAFMAAAAAPIVSLIFGWGSFGADSVATTAICFASYSAGFAFSIVSSLIYRYALALGKLKTITALTYATVALNALLDYAFVYRWGLLGLTAATSLTQAVGFVIYYVVIVEAPLVRFIISAKLLPQLALAGALAFCAHLALGLGSAAALAVSGAMFALYMFAAERLGLMEPVPCGWRPSQFLKFVAGAAKSYAKGI